MERKGLSDSYWLKTPPVPSVTTWHGRDISFEQFLRLWQKYKGTYFRGNIFQQTSDRRNTSPHSYFPSLSVNKCCVCECATPEDISLTCLWLIHPLHSTDSIQIASLATRTDWIPLYVTSFFFQVFILFLLTAILIWFNVVVNNVNWEKWIKAVKEWRPSVEVWHCFPFHTEQLQGCTISNVSLTEFLTYRNVYLKIQVWMQNVRSRFYS